MALISILDKALKLITEISNNFLLFLCITFTANRSEVMNTTPTDAHPNKELISHTSFNIYPPLSYQNLLFCFISRMTQGHSFMVEL